MSVASQFSFGNASVLTSGTLPGNRGVTAGDNVSSFIEFNGNTSTAGQFDSSTTDPTATTRLNYNGSFYATTITANIKPRVVVITGTSAVTIDADTTDIATHSNTQNAGAGLSITATGTPTDGQKLIFRLVSVNSLTLTWNSIFAGSADLVLPVASTGSNKYDYMGFIYNATANKWQILAKNFGF
jgi:hypothetical protein